MEIGELLEGVELELYLMGLTSPGLLTPPQSPRMPLECAELLTEDTEIVKDSTNSSRETLVLPPLSVEVDGGLSGKFSNSHDTLNEQSDEEEGISSNWGSKINGSHAREIAEGVLAV